MQINLQITLLIFTVIMILITTYILKRGRIPEKYALLWYFISLIVLFVVIFPNLLVFVSKHLGFQVMSNMIVAILIGLLLFITMSLTIIVSGQKKKITLLIQEVSLMKADKNGKEK